MPRIRNESKKTASLDNGKSGLGTIVVLSSLDVQYDGMYVGREKNISDSGGTRKRRYGIEMNDSLGPYSVQT